MKNTINNKKICIALILILSIPLFASSVYSSKSLEDIADFVFGSGFPEEPLPPVPSVADQNVLARGFDPTISAWYAVEAWELEVCKKVQNSPLSTATIPQGSVYFSQTTVILQAERTILPDGNFIYSVSHYVEPFEQDAYYAIKLINTSGPIERLVVGKTLVAKNTRAGAVNSFVTDSTFTQKHFNIAEIAIGPDAATINLRIQVPVIGEDFSGCTTGCGTSTATDNWGNWLP